MTPPVTRGRDDVGCRDTTIGERCGERIAARKVRRDVQCASRTFDRIGGETLANDLNRLVVRCRSEMRALPD